MARHSLYPGFIKIQYTSNGHPHVMTLPVVPGGVSPNFTVAKVLGGTYTPWTDAVDALLLLLKVFLRTSDSFDTAELWKIPSVGASPIYQDTYAIGLAGTGTTAEQPYHEAVYTLRTDVGGILRLYILEGISGGDYHLTYAGSASSEKAVFDFLQSSAGFVFGRDEGVPIAPLHLSGKTNDALRKKYLLNA